ncbi:sporulation YhaL family protein [Bacillus sp. CGMCC 1.16541]|uniref:sporulation YhaL family protein n=1 Tax=Bacillus sp. CGMCC 1.16541 TaxID=2185143 RepID=UPI000D7372FE|nr:sporulation YhaL family protein [Bacillus sp. CGMCC 1.16541]
MVTLPIWLYLVVAGIFFSGFMAIRTAQQEKEIDDTFIEQEGQVYMQRMQEEKERRDLVRNSKSV